VANENGKQRPGALNTGELLFGFFSRFVAAYARGRDDRRRRSMALGLLEIFKRANRRLRRSQSLPPSWVFTAGWL